MTLRRVLQTLFRSKGGPPRILLEADLHQLRVWAAETSDEKRIPWTDIRRAVAFKRDVYAHDLLCLIFELHPEGVIELDETMGGWAALIEALPARLPGALPPSEWLPRVTFPAFKETPLEIYRRA